jgi:hypothetical protein
VPPAAVRLRRDFGAVLGLIGAHALLHRATRAETADGAVVATLEDYRVVRILVADVLAEGVGGSVRQTTRDLVAAVKLLGKAANLLSEGEQEQGVSLGRLAAYLKVDKAAVSRRWRVARNGGYLQNLGTQPGRPAGGIPGRVLRMADPRRLRAPDRSTPSEDTGACGPREGNPQALSDPLSEGV